MTQHTGEKPFACEFCSYRAITQSIGNTFLTLIYFCTLDGVLKIKYQANSTLPKNHEKKL